MKETDFKELKALLGNVVAMQAQLMKRLDEVVSDFNEFGDRFEEVMQEVENERRLDALRDYE